MRKAIPISLAFVFALSLASFSHLSTNRKEKVPNATAKKQNPSQPASTKKSAETTFEIWTEGMATKRFVLSQYGTKGRSKLLPNEKNDRFGQKLRINNFTGDAMIDCILEKVEKKTGRIHLRTTKGNKVVGEKCLLLPFGKNAAAEVTLIFQKGRLLRVDQMSPGKKSLYLERRNQPVAKTRRGFFVSIHLQSVETV